MLHETCKEMLAMHALSALDDDDRRALQEHLDSCAACRLELEEWQATAGALAYVAAPLAPSAQLRERILERVRSEDHGHVASHAEPRDSEPPNSAPRSSEPANVLQFSRPAAAARWPAFAAIAASLIFIALTASLIVLWRRNQAATIEVARLTGALRLQEQLLASQNKIVQLMTTPGVRSAELSGTKEAPNAHALLAVDRQSGRAMLLATGLPPAPRGKAYQLWFIAGGQPPAPGKVFTTDGAGNASLEDQLPANANNASTFAVTLEVEGGVPAPTGSMYLLSAAGGR